MIIKAYKYQGTGNDFVIIDNRNRKINLTKIHIAQICHRRFGIGADGLMLLQNHRETDFEMIYYNSDGKTSSMCGNGGRCIVKFAQHLNIIKKETTFSAIDGVHKATIENSGIVNLQMNNVNQINDFEGCSILNTGSPHYVKSVNKLPSDNFFLKEASAIRQSEPFKKEGININYVAIINEDLIEIKTYERGVENETYSCGTGAVAAAIHHILKNNKNKSTINIKTKGGELKVTLNVINKTFQNIWLSGPAQKVFETQIEI